ncbi:MAG: hypothetical protein ABSE73_29175 [Planctomycetota bacterium]
MAQPPFCFLYIVPAFPPCFKPAALEIEALGGQLEIIAHLPRADIRIRQFKEAS